MYVGVTKDEVQRSRWTFYEVVNFGTKLELNVRHLIIRENSFLRLSAKICVLI